MIEEYQEIILVHEEMEFLRELEVITGKSGKISHREFLSKLSRELLTILE